ncbi:winged helix-turn-helix domain-containing protein [Yersinia kristensenii]|uniref:winged helix-turn-helix domain-containing protein n=1 Tax=Yersinia kristensenii TaxID=28152 RepID=UPI0005DFE065|nr:hypothetical protein [Yersinia kristensenii]CNE49235.1 putative transcriptional regulator CadC [Yersinia kristensenii]
MKTKYHLSKTSSFECDTPILKGNTLTFIIQKKEIILSKNQTKLITCLLNEINEKKDIITFIWSRNSYKSKENNYNQLIYQTRTLFINAGFAEDFIMTIPRYGLCLNKNNLITKTPAKYYSTNMLDDHATCF